MNNLTYWTFITLWGIAWMMGAALAKGAAFTFFAMVFPPYAWMLTAQWLMGV